MIHTVSPGETLTSIANMYGVSVQKIIYDNQLNREGRLVVGQALLILIPERIHIVSPGETVNSISGYYGLPPKQLLKYNPFLLNQAYLLPGETLAIGYTGESLRPERVIGYAYPFILPDILRETLLYIDELLVFSYGFTMEGELIPPQGEFELISQAMEFGVEPILVLTPFAETGSFNNQLVHVASQDLQVQNQLIYNLLYTVQTKNYRGVDVDFEYILPEDREGYADFVGNLRRVMNANGFKVSVALAPKVSDDQPGLLYEGMDYGALGANADTVFLMTYEWGYTYGPPMAVAPVNKVRQVLDYAVTKISVDKILMGIPNYAYDWPLPFVRGETKARTIGNVQAVEIALENGAVIQFDDVALSPYFVYTKEGVSHEVWFEDVRSIQIKLRLAREYGFLGVGYWNLMRPFRANWLLLL